MALNERFERYGSPSREWQETIHIYHVKAECMSDPDDIARRDKYTAEDIKRLESLLDDLKAYRLTLQKRYAEVETMSYKRVLRLERVPSYGSGVAYYVRLRRDYEDGTSHEEEHERFDGKNRHNAMKRFEELKKKFPGIATEKDIERRSWERK